MDRPQFITDPSQEINLEQIARRIREVAELAAQEHLDAIARSQADRLVRLARNNVPSKPTGTWR